MKSMLRLSLLLILPLALTACGEGWEARRTTDVFPYGSQRTAGSGIIYVRAKLLPEKELKVEAPLPPAPVQDDTPEKMEKVFDRAQTK
jgi:hypothetical protein